MMSIELAKKCGAKLHFPCGDGMNDNIKFTPEQLATYEAAIREDERKGSEPVAIERLKK